MVGDYTKLSFENVDFIFWNYPLFNFSTCEDKAVWSPTVSMIPALEKKIWIKKKQNGFKRFITQAPSDGLLVGVLASFYDCQSSNQAIVQILILMCCILK